MGSTKTKEVMPRKRKKSVFSLLKEYKSADWRRAISVIDNDFLQIKIACIVFWDFYCDEEKNCPVYLKKLIRSYDMFPQEIFDMMINEEEIFQNLLRIGYPIRLAKRRSFYERVNDQENY